MDRGVKRGLVAAGVVAAAVAALIGWDINDRRAENRRLDAEVERYAVAARQAEVNQASREMIGAALQDAEFAALVEAEPTTASEMRALRCDLARDRARRDGLGLPDPACL